MGFSTKAKVDMKYEISTAQWTSSQPYERPPLRHTKLGKTGCRPGRPGVKHTTDESKSKSKSRSRSQVRRDSSSHQALNSACVPRGRFHVREADQSE